MNNNIATAYVQFIQRPGGKRRPVFVIRETGEKLFFFDITTKYQNKSEFIKQWYFEIKEYQTTGLNRHSWIDTYQMYSLDKTVTEVKYIGKLSDVDTARLRKFIKKLRRDFI